MHHNQPPYSNSIDELISQDPLLQNLKETITQFTTDTVLNKHFHARNADELAEEGKYLPEIKRLFGNFYS